MSFPCGLPSAADPPSSPGSWYSLWECINKLARAGVCPLIFPKAPWKNTDGRVPSANVCALMGNELPLAPEPRQLEENKAGARNDLTSPPRECFARLRGERQRHDSTMYGSPCLCKHPCGCRSLLKPRPRGGSSFDPALRLLSARTGPFFF